MYTWGLGSNELGHGPQENQLTFPQLVEALLPERGGGRVEFISAQSSHTCAVTDTVRGGGGREMATANIEFYLVVFR